MGQSNIGAALAVFLLLPMAYVSAQADPPEEVPSPASIPSAPTASGELSQLLARAVLPRLRLGSGSYVRWCRRLDGGCEAHARRFGGLVVEFARLHELDPWTVAAVGVKGSATRPDAVGRAGELGMFQLNPRNRHYIAFQAACSRGLTHRDCLRGQVRIATSQLRYALDRCGSYDRALRAYNTGSCTGEVDYPGRVARIRRQLMESVGASDGR